MYIDLGLVCCDRPLACALTGAPHYKGDSSPCFRCLISKKDLLDNCTHPTRSYELQTASVRGKVASYLAGLRHHDENSTQNVFHVDRRSGARTNMEVNGTKSLWKKTFPNGEHLSVLDLFPWFNRAVRTVVDSMHAVLEGVLKTYWYKVLCQGMYSGGEKGSVNELADVVTGESKDENREVDPNNEPEKSTKKRKERSQDVSPKRQKKRSRKVKWASKSGKPVLTTKEIDWFKARIPLVYKPTSIENLSSGFGTKGNGKVKASQWRVFGEIYGPLIVPFFFEFIEPSLGGRTAEEGLRGLQMS